VWIEIEIEWSLDIGAGFAEARFGMTNGIEIVAATMPRTLQVPVALRASEVAALVAFVSIDIPFVATVANAVFAVEEGGEEATW